VQFLKALWPRGLMVISPGPDAQSKAGPRISVSSFRSALSRSVPRSAWQPVFVRREPRSPAEWRLSSHRTPFHFVPYCKTASASFVVSHIALRSGVLGAPRSA